MNIAHDYKTSMTSQPQGRADGTGSDSDSLAPIDWHDLRTRLFAAHEVRAELAGGEAGGDIRSLAQRLRGSFDEEAASVLTTYEAVSKPVNPTASGYLKPGEGMCTPVAGKSSSGGRG